MLLSFLFLVACADEPPLSGPSDNGPVNIAISHFPQIPVPADRPLTKKRIALGKRLFEDPILSRNNNISCASCHLTPKAFTDGLPVSVGTEGRRTLRNSPTLFNVAWQPYLFMDGGNPTLESQAIGPIEEHSEMDIPFTQAMARVANHPDYPVLFKEAFADDVNPFTLTTALGTYQRALVSYNSRFDQFFYFGDSSALSLSEQNGLALFVSQNLSCQSCHSLPLTTNFNFENNGLKADFSNDEGRARVTLNPADIGKFKVATLRNVELTAPFMHDGSLETLEQVIEHYASGGKNHPLQSELINGFTISESEKQDLVNFLKALTDTNSFRQYTQF